MEREEEGGEESGATHHVVMRMKSEDLESLGDNVARLERETYTERALTHTHTHAQARARTT